MFLMYGNVSRFDYAKVWYSRLTGAVYTLSVMGIMRAHRSASFSELSACEEDDFNGNENMCFLGRWWTQEHIVKFFDLLESFPG